MNVTFAVPQSEEVISAVLFMTFFVYFEIQWRSSKDYFGGTLKNLLHFHGKIPKNLLHFRNYYENLLDKFFSEPHVQANENQFYKKCDTFQSTDSMSVECGCEDDARRFGKVELSIDTRLVYVFIQMCQSCQRFYASRAAAQCLYVSIYFYWCCFISPISVELYQCLANVISVFLSPKSFPSKPVDRTAAVVTCVETI